jgi:pimeloyl-ACP methyl ester carboxylesterase
MRVLDEVFFFSLAITFAVEGMVAMNLNKFKLKVLFLLSLLGPQSYVQAATVEACLAQLQYGNFLPAETVAQGLSRGDFHRVHLIVREPKHKNQVRELNGVENLKTKTVYKNIVPESLEVEMGGRIVRTMMYHHKDGVVPDYAKALVVLLHGIGADISHSGAMLPIINFLGGTRTEKQSGFTHRIHQNYVPLGLVALDGPGNGYGPSIAEVPDLNSYIHLLQLQLSKLKSLSKGRPLIVFARSASTGHMVELNRQFPELVDAMILMSPMTSDPVPGAKAQEGLNKDVSVALERLRQGLPSEFMPLPDLLHWDEKMYEAMDWHRLSNPLGGKPTLAMFGTNDLQTPTEVRDFYRGIMNSPSDSNGNPYEIEVVESAGHDVVSVNGGADVEDRGIRTYHRILDFIKKVISLKSS